ncbi:S8 family serine peptidase [Oricola indica]|uniref:S8 family serine peptidase n=1 Tax=Oricola indica TaxID=2872591 RepID=UPI002367C7A6|nr:S8 family serine peptidase [Oricola indica]
MCPERSVTYVSCRSFQNIVGDDVTLNDQIKSDGWAAFSGTSAATPQVAGICALLLQAEPNLKPHEVKSILLRSADPVWNAATGSPEEGAAAGLANALRVLRALG